MRISALGIAAVGLTTSAAFAVPITYIGGPLASGETRFGTIVMPPGDTNGNDNPATWHWYTFFAVAGDNVTVDVDRTNANMDPVSATLFGTSADTSPATTITGMNGGAVPTGMSFVAIGDDNEPDPFGGPFGDPLYSFVAGSTGTYSVVVGNFLGNPTGPYNYQIVVTGQTPTPGAAALLGLAGLATTRRRRA